MITAAVFAALAAAGGLLRWAGRAGASSIRRAAAGTMVANLSGAFALGLLVGAHPDTAVVTAIGVGGLGSVTTFSTMVGDTFALAEGPGRADAAAYLTATLAGGVALADLGLRLTG